jgi:hypothetical protein
MKNKLLRLSFRKPVSVVGQRIPMLVHTILARLPRRLNTAKVDKPTHTCSLSCIEK